MNYTEYTLSEIMIRALRNGKLSDELTSGLFDVKQRTLSVRMCAILNSLKLLQSESDVVLADQCRIAINDIAKLLKKNTLDESDLRKLLECVEDFERAEYRCKEIVAIDWNNNLSKLPQRDKQLNSYKLLIRSVCTKGYRNEANYPIISTSLITPEKMNIYQERSRTISLVYDMCADYLIAMSTRDSNTSIACNNDPIKKVLEFPLHSNFDEITSTFGVNDSLKLFEDYYADSLESMKINPSDCGEIIFSSRITPKAVLLHENIRSDDEIWGRGYASVYDLPIYRLVRPSPTGNLVLEQV